jgi:hypothetical protein
VAFSFCLAPSNRRLRCRRLVRHLIIVGVLFVLTAATDAYGCPRYVDDNDVLIIETDEELDAGASAALLVLLAVVASRCVPRNLETGT